MDEGTNIALMLMIGVLIMGLFLIIIWLYLEDSSRMIMEPAGYVEEITSINVSDAMDKSKYLDEVLNPGT